MRNQAQGIRSVLKITYLDSDKALIHAQRVWIWLYDVDNHARLFPSYKSWINELGKTIEQIKPKTGVVKYVR